MASKLVRTLFVLSMLALSPACTVWEYELGLPLSGAGMVDARGASLKDVLEQLGPPLRVSALDRGFVLGWEYWQVRDASLGFSLGAAGADILSVDFGAVQVAGEFLLLTFDAGRRLTGGSFARWDSSAGAGAALQPLVGLATLTDVDDLIEALPQHESGRGLAAATAGSSQYALAPGYGWFGCSATRYTARNRPADPGNEGLKPGFLDASVLKNSFVNTKRS